MRALPSLVAALLVAGLASPVAAGQQPSAPAADPPSYYFILGRHLENEGKIDDAIAAHKQAIILAPEAAELRAELAGLYARQDRAAEAVAMAKAALEHDPDNREANRTLGTIYAALSEQRQPITPGDNPAEYPAKAIAALEKSRGDTFNINVDLMLGRLYAQTGAFEKALPLLRHVVDDQPGYQDGALLLAVTQESAGRPDEAAVTLEQTLQVNPAFYRGQLRLADIYERARRWPEAARALERAQALNARNTALTPRRAVALINSGKAAEARDLLQKATEAPGAKPDPSIVYLLAEAQRAAHDLTGAEATARKLLAADPADTRGLHVLSLIQQERGDAKGAEATLRDLVARHPDDGDALNSLGYLLAERGDRLAEAVQFLQRALKVDPENPSFLDSLGWAYFQQGRLAQADAPLTQAASSLQTSSVVQDHLGDLRFKQQRFADAATAWERALAGDGQSIDRAKIEKKIRDARARMDQK